MKKSHGEGTLYRKSDGKFRAQVSVGGQRLSYSGSQRECEAWLRKMRGQIEKGLTWGAARMTEGDLSASWLGIQNTQLRLAAQQQYGRLARLYIVPGLGRTALRDLSAAIVQEFYRKIQQKGAGARTVQLVHTVLHGVLEHGRKLGLVVQNYTDLVETPRPEKHEMMVWDESQVSLFLTRVEDSTFYRLAFSTGMRRGEIIGLQWKDLDWRSGILTVRRQVYEPQGGGWRFQEPKSRAGVRSIRLGPGMIEALRRQFNRDQPLARQLAGDQWIENDLIFPNSLGKPRNGYEVSKRFQRRAAEAGLPAIRFHDIRHTAASIMLMHGEPPVRVAMILGQGLAVLLSTYAHYIPDDSERAALLMDEITTPIPLPIEIPIGRGKL